MEAAQKFTEKLKDFFKEYDHQCDHLNERGEDNPLHFDEAIDEIQCEVLEFCACGVPDIMVKYIRDSLHHIHVWHANIITDFSQWDAMAEGLFKTKEAEYLMYYYLDKLELTEHGGSVPGWLAPKGKDLLELLNMLDYDNEDFKV